MGLAASLIATFSNNVAGFTSAWVQGIYQQRIRPRAHDEHYTKVSRMTNVAGDYRMGGVVAGMEAILTQKEIPTAVITANDLTAIGALRKAHERGLRIPDDISIAGCDDIEMRDIVYPPLTTDRCIRDWWKSVLATSSSYSFSNSSSSRPSPTP